jgi:hypothetical protein
MDILAAGMLLTADAAQLLDRCPSEHLIKSSYQLSLLLTRYLPVLCFIASET